MVDKFNPSDNLARPAYLMLGESLDTVKIVLDATLLLCEMFGLAADFGILRWNPAIDSYEPIVANAVFGRERALLSFATRCHGTSETIIVPDQRRGPAVFMPLCRRDDFDAALAVFTPDASTVMGDEKKVELETFRVALGQALANADRYESGRREYKELEAVKQTWEHLWLAVENQQKMLDRLMARNQALYDIGITINASLNQRDVLATIVSEAVKLLQASRGALALWDSSSNELQLLAEHRLPTPDALISPVDLDTFPHSIEAEENYRIRGNAAPSGGGSNDADNSFGSTAIARLRTFLTDYWNVPAAEAERVVASVGVRTGDMSDGPTILAPIVWHQQTLGVIVLNDLTPGRIFNADDKHTLVMIANQAAVAIENTRLFRDVTEERNRNRAILNSIADGVFTTDLDLRITSFNPAAETITKRWSENVLGQRYATALALTDRDGQPLTPEDSPCKQAIAQRAPTSPRIVRISLPDGAFLLITLAAAPIVDSYGDIAGVVGIFRDVTREQEVVRMKDEFVSLVSHELRTPMSSVLGFSELMLTRSLNENKTRQYVEIIHKEAQRLSNLINDFLDIQRLEAGQQVYMFKPVAITQLLGAVQNLFRTDTTHRLVTRIPSNLPNLWVDTDRIIQTLTNLVGNAIKYSPEGGEIHLSARVTPENMVEISVQDRGLGIPEDAIAKLFNKFYRVDNSDRRAIGGTGLGLAISREIVEAHGGRIGVRSKEKEGSTFFFTVHPVAGDGKGPAPMHQLAAPIGENQLAHVNKNSDVAQVLIIEDDENRGALIGASLEKAGFGYLLAGTAQAAMEALNSFTPIAIVVDIDLPDERDGWDVLIHLRNHPHNQHVPIIVSTTLDNRTSGTNPGAVDFLRKPVNVRKMLDVLSRVTAASQGRRVLIIDDDVNLRHMLQEALIGHDFIATIAENGAQGIELARARPDAIILDLMMPHMDGFEVLSTLRADRQTIDIPVVVVTAKELTKSERRFLREEIAHFLKKSEATPQRIRDLIIEAVTARDAITTGNPS